MTTSLTPTWVTEDLPVLAAAIEIYDEKGRATGEEIASNLDRPSDDVTRSLVRLESEYLELKHIDSMGMRNIRPPLVTSVSGNARRAVGQWPDPDKMTADIITQLEKAAESQAPDKRKAITEFLRGATGEVAGIGGTVLGSAIRAYVGM